MSYSFPINPKDHSKVGELVEKKKVEIGFDNMLGEIIASRIAKKRHMYKRDEVRELEKNFINAVSLHVNPIIRQSVCVSNPEVFHRIDVFEASKSKENNYLIENKVKKLIRIIVDSIFSSDVPNLTKRKVVTGCMIKIQCTANQF